MVFSSPVFRFLFLPIVLALYFLAPWRLKNLVLLTASLVFFYWGEQFYSLLLLVSIVGNWLCGLWVDRVRENRPAAKRAVALAVVFNLVLLGFFKYADFVVRAASDGLLALGWIAEPLPKPGELLGDSQLVRAFVLTGTGDIRLPIGISFFTFQALSYVIDVYRRDGPVQKNPLDFALYKSLFPQLIAGPIVRYKDVAAQIISRKSTLPGFAYGVRRFVIGLGKKVLVGDILALPADQIFALAPAERSMELAWLGIACYALHLYYDFSGYSDMAIGLGKMFGFNLLENFDYPFISRSVTEFWRRWHISLSNWFRDYVYYPLGGSRKGVTRTYVNLLVVFTFCGLWHGAGWTFLAFGLFQGVFLVMERLCFKERVPTKGWYWNVYVLLVFAVTWVIFRTDSMGAAIRYTGALFGANPLVNPGRPLAMYLDPLVATVLVLAMIGATPWLRWAANRKVAWERQPARAWLGSTLEVTSTCAVLLILGLSMLQVSASSYSPFVYFRF